MPTRRVRRAQRARRRHRVEVGELRQNLRVYLARIAQGEAVNVTDRGRPVAVLAPLPRTATLVERLVESGRATAATKTNLPPVGRRQSQRGRGLGPRIQKALREGRRDSV